MADRILIDIRTCELTMREVMDQVHRFIEMYPEDEIFMDAYAIVARPRKARA